MTETMPGSPHESLRLLAKHLETSPRFTLKGVVQTVTSQLLANATNASNARISPPLRWRVPSLAKGPT